MADYKSLWLGWSARFAALQKREKLMVGGALAFAILFGGYTFWVEPAALQKARLQKAIVQQQGELSQLQAQLAALAKQGSDPDAANRALLEELRRETATLDQDIQGFEKALVSPAQAPALLQTLLARHRGITLVSLKTLAPQPLVAPPRAAEEGKAAAPTGNIYRHGIEIKLAGSYLDLLAYVGEVENSPQRLMWGGMQLVARTHPVNELTLTVYTLSLESTWLVV
jgi:MSHA biogenesis protein MshJ